MAGRTRSRRPGETPVTSPRRRRSVPPIVFFAAAGVVVLIAVVAAAVAYVLGGDGGGGDRPQAAPPPTVRDVPAEGPGASAYSQAASTPAFAVIADRSKDAKPLTAAQAFGTKKITDGDARASLRLTASSLDARCTTAIWGAGLAGRLAQGGCTQAVRATYSDQHFAALVTIFNMADAKAADQVVADADPRAANGFPLAPPRSTPFGRGFSIARGVAMGHYAVITWVQRAEGTGDERDAALLSLLVTAGRPNAILVRATGQNSPG